MFFCRQYSLKERQKRFTEKGVSTFVETPFSVKKKKVQQYCTFVIEN
jgi:hypothetical protein